MAVRLPERLVEKARRFLESSYGATRVTAILKDGTRIEHVFLAGGEEIVKIGDTMIETRADLPFDPADVVRVISEV